MAQLDNPAGRLAAIIADYNENAAGAMTDVVWREVLACSQADLPLALARVCGVLTDIEKALMVLRDEDLTDAFNHWKGHWAGAIVRPYDAMQTVRASNEDFNPGGLLSLRLMSSHLHSLASEGPTGSDDERNTLREHLEEAIDRIIEDDSIPADLRRLVHERLLDIQFALDQFRITGPAGVVRATERLAGSIQLESLPVRVRWFQFDTVRTALHVAGRAWALFKMGSEASTAIEGWSDVIAALPVGGDET